MSERPDPFCCPHCGSTHFVIERQITVWQTLTINAVCPRGHYDVQDEALGEDATEHAIQHARCACCHTAMAVQELLPWTALPAPCEQEAR